ncbi:hypothetical protein KCU81_g9482, partial [Aureobasidium melanogenum]
MRPNKTNQTGELRSSLASSRSGATLAGPGTTPGLRLSMVSKLPLLLSQVIWYHVDNAAFSYDFNSEAFYVFETILNPVFEVILNPVFEVILNPVFEVILNPVFEVILNPVFEVILNPVFEAILNDFLHQ